MIHFKRFAALALALAVCSVSGCTIGEETRIAATYDGGEVPAGIYIVNQVTALNEAYYQVENPSGNLLSQQIDGVSVSDWVNNRAAELTRSYVAVESEFERLGLILDPADAAVATQGLRQAWESEQAEMEQIGVSYASVEAASLNAAKSQQLFAAYYGVEGERAVPEAEYESFYRENYSRVLMLVFSKQYDQISQSAFEGDAVAAQQALIESYFDRSRAGENTFDLIVEENARIEAGIAATRDSGAAPVTLVEEDEITLVYRENTNLPQGLRDQIFAGDALNTPEIYEDENYGVIFERRALMEDTEAYESAKASMLPQMKQQEYTDGLLATADSLGVTLVQDAIKKFKVDRLLRS